MHDPGLQSLRRAARVAIVVPVLFAIFLNGFDNPVAALFAGFGSFAFLGFADFGGPPPARARAYGVLVGVGAVLVVVGTVVSNEAVIAALVGVAVAAVARFAGFFGGYYGASVSPLILAYVLAATIPAPADAIPDRLLGWLVAGAVSTVAALVLWPRRERLRIREAAAEAAGVVADAVAMLATPDGPSPEAVTAVRDAVAKLGDAASVPRRPAGPSAHDAALAFLVDQLERAALLVSSADGHAPTPTSTGLARVGADAFRAVERTLRASSRPADLDALVTSCIDAKHAVVQHAIAELGGGGEPGGVLEEIDECFVERLILVIAAAALVNASVVVSGRGPSDGTVSIPLEAPVPGDRRAVLTRLRELVESNAVSASAWAQESLRAGVAVGVAIFIADELRLDHGFWVALGTLSVLRSNAFETGRSALMAAAGTAIGFAISAAVLGLIGIDHDVLWVVVAVGFFLSAYTPQVVGFVAGQVCFTIAVVAMFNLIEPQGWQTGLVRFENILIGSGVSAVVALFFWPRRASVGLRKNLAELYRRLARGIASGIVHPESEEPVAAAEQRAHASYVQYLSETARAPAGRRPWASLLGDAAQVRFAIETLQRHRGVTRFDACGPTRTAFHEVVDEVAAVLDATATRLVATDHAGGTALDVGSVAAVTRDPVCACLGRHAHETGPDGPLAAGLDAALVRDLLMDVTAVADHALAAAPTARDG
ncbi:MAG TPA: FUSC family protein [Acidimicrobiia bacterium]